MTETAYKEADDGRVLDARNTEVRELDLMRQAIDNKQLKKAFGTINVSTRTTAYADYEFHLSNNELYTIQSGDRIGIEYTGGDTNNWVAVMLDLDPADPFDGTNSYHQYYQGGGWLSNTGRDMYMVLKQTHA